ncbi:uncharacterized protein Z520_00012 [Fonsecaea multimorphosa CBS 102226]|uniref:SPT2 chromatin protein n=1 Tax=Fonsecaea multimorphosa CBS 102226 TaxID=1442371 RepID=A0A0D2HNB9_9EURO|nr:uncharacterized protein Z520_00012 [Fonsecaea multimorphosa CBS 102226]KIY03321.1 hypothetical protein Z520_00012 [Fonsecaea multimorphosa CBS 102226]OAL32972.1 hypothetical protein AYO22_00057 [Fonsecaea multimorphosa]
MSLFSDIVNSIGSDKSPAPPKPPARPLSANAHRPNLDVSKPGSRPGLPAAPSPLNGIKRKADDSSAKPPEKLIKPNPIPGLTSTIAPKRPAAPPLNAPKPTNGSEGKTLPTPRPRLDAQVTSAKPGSAPSTPTTASAKGPAKGSYAELIARAKQAQVEKAQQSQVGLIKHQATNREKPSRLAERRRQEEEKAKGAKEKSSGGRLANGGKRQDKSRSASPAKKTDQPKVPKAPRPPLHAPPSSSYKGTMGTTSGRTKPPPKRARYDEYLGTDEEDVSDDMGGYGEDEEDYGSEGSSDMEAGAFDVYEEEQKALRAAREEDARELALENQLKREKEERRKRLMSLAGRKK